MTALFNLHSDIWRKSIGVQITNGKLNDKLSGVESSGNKVCAEFASEEATMLK